MSILRHPFVKKILRRKKKVLKQINKYFEKRFPLKEGEEVVLFDVHQKDNNFLLLLALAEHKKQYKKFIEIVPVFLLVLIILIELSLPIDTTQAEQKESDTVYPTTAIEQEDFVNNSTVQDNLQQAEIPPTVTPTPEIVYVYPTATPIPQPIIPTPLPRPVISTENFRPSNFDQVYKDAGAKYGIPWQILYGIHLTETGLRDGPISNYQGSGAQGPMQFMPGTWRAYGVDGNGDGVADINNAVDAIYGAANFMAKHGSIDAGLRAYGGNYSGVLAAARSRGYEG